MASLDRLAGLIARQAGACGRLGSPMYESLLHRVAAESGREGPVRRVLEAHADASGASATGVRLLGAVHRLVLQRRAGELAVFYPSVGGSWEPSAGWAAFVDVLDECADDVRDGMRRPPQTNEVGRAAALIGGLLRLVAEDPLPVRLLELGASAGLNLRADHFRYVGAGGAWGPEDSPVRLEPAWLGTPTPVERPLVLIERLGCDPDPIDPTSSEGRLTLTSYVWPDQQARLDRLRGAFAVASRVPATVRRQRAVDLLAATELATGALTVLWHSMMWQYLDRAEQDTVEADIRRLGAQATAEAPFARLSLEPRPRTEGAPHDFLVVAQCAGLAVSRACWAPPRGTGFRSSGSGERSPSAGARYRLRHDSVACIPSSATGGGPHPCSSAGRTRSSRSARRTGTGPARRSPSTTTTCSAC